MTAEKEAGTSVLATLTAEVMADKKTAARKLTPVEGEVAPPALPRTEAMFPNDMPQEVVEQKAAELTRIIGHLTEARDALLTLANRPVPTEVVDLDAARKQREFEADFNAKQREAQEATFHQRAEFANDREDAADQIVAESEFEWVCPTHGKATMKTSAKTGRQYVGCPDCNLFQR